MNKPTKHYPTIQANGQRIYFPNPSTPAPPRGSEIFVGNLPSDVYEDELIPLFSKAGRIYKLRVMMDFDGFTRGFTFICYRTPEEAHAAVLVFHNTAIRPGLFMAVHLSLDNRRLFVGNIPRNKNAEEIQGQLSKFLDGVVHVIVYEQPSNPRVNRGFAFVEFQSHTLAAIARRKMSSSGEGLWGKKRSIVDWAFPEPVVHPAVLMQVKTLFFGNIPIKCTQSRFRRFLWTVLDRNDIERVYKKENYAFVHFKTKYFAQIALRKLRSEYLIIYSRQITVEWARPITYSRKTRQNEIQDNFCMSASPDPRYILRKSW